MRDLGQVMNYFASTVCVVHLADIKFGDLGANTSWLTFSLANQLSIVRYTANYK